MNNFYSKTAQFDIDEIFVYIAKQSDTSISDEVIDSITSTCDLIGDFPEMGRRRPEFDDFGYEVRSIAEGSYMILYTVTSVGVYVVRVVHGARDIDSSDLYPLADATL